MSNIIKTIGIILPEDFPAEQYETVNNTISKIKDDKQGIWKEFAGGWNAVAYRYMSCKESNDNFISSVLRTTNAPYAKERYIQERELFFFFLSGLSSIESFFYSLYFIGALLKPKEFPNSSEKNKRSITPEATKDKFLSEKSEFKQDDLALKLKELIDSYDYKDWKELRNILAHRTATTRDIFAGGDKDGTVLWAKGIPIDAETTTLRFDWLTSWIFKLIIGTNTFVTKYQNRV